MGRDQRQRQIVEWCIRAFGFDQANSPEQRGLRLAEEAIEAAQAVGCDPATLHKLIDYIYARPPGKIGQEIGGVSVTLLAYAGASGLSADDCEQLEVNRVLAKPLADFTARNKEKNDAGFVVRRKQ